MFKLFNRSLIVPIFGILLLLIINRCVNNKSEIDASKNSNYYTEKHRPQFHFTPDSMWMNDPNGMVFYEGEYHLFYQYYPDSTVWGPMHWGHAVSLDMVHWEHLPIALYPDSLGYIFSGSAVIDWENTSGFGKNGKPPMVAIYTYHDIVGEKAGLQDFQSQGIAYSNDNGKTWTKYDGNPVVPNNGIRDFRDPKVIWHKESKKWIMVLAVKNKASFYSSPDLKSWNYESDFGIKNEKRLWECPDLFPIKVSETGETNWVLIVSMQSGAPNGGTGSSYFVGDFDGKIFKATSGQKWLDYGTDNYAFVTWSDIPENDGRRLGLGWMSNWLYAQVVPTEKWRSAMTLPRSMTLHKVGNDYEIRSMPVSEVAKLDGKVVDISLNPSSTETIITDGSEIALLYKLNISFARPSKDTVLFRFSNPDGQILDFGFIGNENVYFVDRSKSSDGTFYREFLGMHKGLINYYSDSLHMEVFLDHSSIEIFGDQGRCVMTDIFFPASCFNKLELVNRNISEMKTLDVKVTQLNRTWK